MSTEKISTPTVVGNTNNNNNNNKNNNNTNSSSSSNIVQVLTTTSKNTTTCTNQTSRKYTNIICDHSDISKNKMGQLMSSESIDNKCVPGNSENSDNHHQSNDSTICQKPSTTTVTRKNQQFITQQIVTSRRVKKYNSEVDSNQLSLMNDSGNSNNNSIDNNNKSNPLESNPDQDGRQLIKTNDFEGKIMSGGKQCNVKRVTKTYRRRIIKKIGPNGEITEQIIEEGDPFDSQLLNSLPTTISSQLALTSPTNSLPLTTSSASTELVPRSTSSFTSPLCNSSTVAGDARESVGKVNMKATAGFKTVSETGEEQSAHISSGPIEANFMGGNNSQQMLTDGEVGECNSLMLPDSGGNSVQEVLPDGTIITRKFNVQKSATVTHSSTINGETKTSSKSAYMCFTGESMNQAQSSMDDMENIFQEMMKNVGGNPFCIMDQFIQSKDNNILDHLALAGGCSESSNEMLAIEPAHTDVTHEHHESTVSKLNKFIRNPKKILSASSNSSSSSSSSHSHPESIPEQGIASHTPDAASVTNPAPAIVEVWNTQLITKQQEQDLIRKKIEEIREKKSLKGLYWSEMDEVRNSGILSNMKKEEIHLQEALFEIITSEASYNIGLDTLINYYYKNDLLDPNSEDSIINPIEKHHLFSNVLLVKAVSYKLLKDLETKWSQHKPQLIDLCDVLLKHAEDEDFKQQYVLYLTNQSYQIEALRTLLQNDQFKVRLQAIQSDPNCGKLSLDSFLALPMQRLTRMKLLVDVVLKLMNQCPEFLNKTPKDIVNKYELALQKFKELLTKSEENKYRMDQKARMMDLLKILEFPAPCKGVSLGGQELIKEGEVKAHLKQISLSILKKFSKKKQPTLYLLIFTDTVILAKKKAPSKLLVMDYCSRDKVTAEPFSDNQKIVNNPNNPGHKTSTSSLNFISPKLSRDRSVGSSMSSQSSRDSTVTLDPSLTNGQSFVIKFESSKTGIMTEPLVLSVINIDVRDQWLSAISCK